jgi:hypothetical protein
MLFVGDVQNKRHLQSTKNLHEKEGQDDDTDYVYISLTLSLMRTPKLCRHPLVSVSRYSDGHHSHFCSVLIVIFLQRAGVVTDVRVVVYKQVLKLKRFLNACLYTNTTKNGGGYRTATLTL